MAKKPDQPHSNQPRKAETFPVPAVASSGGLSPPWPRTQPVIASVPQPNQQGSPIVFPPLRTTESAADLLRKIVKVMDNTLEDFNDRWDMDQLIKIYRAFFLCGWEITPDDWTADQVDEALAGKVPCWDDNQKPIPSNKTFV